MRYFETDEYQFHSDEVAHDERWLRDMAEYDAEEQAIQEHTALAFGLATWQPWHLGDLDRICAAVEAGCPF